MRTQEYLLKLYNPIRDFNLHLVPENNIYRISINKFQHMNEEQDEKIGSPFFPKLKIKWIFKC